MSDEVDQVVDVAKESVSGIDKGVKEGVNDGGVVVVLDS